jgi:hypothetical protein
VESSTASASCLPVRLGPTDSLAVTSDQGWSGDLVYMSDLYERPLEGRGTVENWERCADGTAVPGQQAFTFWRGYPGPSKISGWDQTIGPSGGCGFNKWLNVRMPFTLTPFG